MEKNFKRSQGLYPLSIFYSLLLILPLFLFLFVVKLSIGYKKVDIDLLKSTNDLFMVEKNFIILKEEELNKLRNSEENFLLFYCTEDLSCDFLLVLN